MTPKIAVMDNLYSRQFGYKLEFLYKMVKLGAKIKEIPRKYYPHLLSRSV